MAWGIRRRSLLGVAALGSLASLPVAAQSGFPSKPLRVIVPYPPGAGMDNISRAFAQELAKVVGQPVVVDNRPGAGSSVGTIAAKGLPADGYTLLTHADNFLYSKLVDPSLGYEISDFEALGPLAESGYVLIVAGDRGWKDLKDIKSLNRELDLASLDIGGVGVYSMLAGKLAADLGIRTRAIPFKGGVEALTAVLAGEVDGYFSTVGTALSAKGNPRATVLAYMGTPGGENFFPGVKTFYELGMRDMVYRSSYTVAVRSDTPAPIKEQLTRATNQALASDAMKTARRRLYLEDWTGTMDEYRRNAADKVKDFQAALAAAGKAAK